ncbi:MAG: hypothetical protein CO149_02265 [Nitrospirae bacterium CG_4_9_14_3_um_filter_51_5]|nr:MAG: hypothetical protein CO149_02265 [Nitrospirae bacterium CG_4_9_14_3_um_filter_51_5]
MASLAILTKVSLDARRGAETVTTGGESAAWTTGARNSVSLGAADIDGGVSEGVEEGAWEH